MVTQMRSNGTASRPVSPSSGLLSFNGLTLCEDNRAICGTAWKLRDRSSTEKHIHRDNIFACVITDRVQVDPILVNFISGRTALKDPGGLIPNHTKLTETLSDQRTARCHTILTWYQLPCRQG